MYCRFFSVCAIDLSNLVLSRDSAARLTPLALSRPACGGLAIVTQKYCAQANLAQYFSSLGGEDEIRTRGTVTRTAV